MINVPADLSSSSPWTTLISLQPKGARKVHVCVNSGFTLVRIKEAPGNSALPLIFKGARFNPAHSLSHHPGLGVAVLLIRLLVA